MQYLGGVRVIPSLPKQVKRLKDLAYNLYFSWNPEVRDLFIAIDRELWKSTNHNPVKFLNEVQQKKLNNVSSNEQFIEQYQKVVTDFDRYLSAENTWFKTTFPDKKNMTIAYFTAEFGFHESLPIYAGGLGVLAGDHLKSASDLDIPIVGISLFYHQTYFTQEINNQGQQIAHYNNLNPVELPLTLVEEEPGKPLLVRVPVAKRKVALRIWEAKVGRRIAYLLDANIPENSKNDREITSRLYGGDQELRIAQEIILGMGGTMVLKALKIEPDVWHMNEGHSVFLALQRIQNLVLDQKLKFEEALQVVTANTIFTTHTPVPAGNDAFPLHIKDKYFQEYWVSVGINRHQFMELGSQIQPEGYEIFNLTILALNLSRFRNGVSKLHGEVSRHLWKTVWPDVPAQEVPITHITNGVHFPSWIARKTRELYSKYLNDEWLNHQDDKQYWSEISKIPDQAIWDLKLELKKKMLNHIREKLSIQYERNKIGSLQILRTKQYMNPQVLTVGFARRFATYKRGTLIFRNIERLKKLVNDPDRPIQFIFAGKAHPKDAGGQDLIRQIHQFSMNPEFRGKVVFVENYDMGLARDLVSGVDVWLNTPRRTQEASGTSGQKAAINGTLNLSILDGWWAEGYSPQNGWAFGDKEHFSSLEEWDSWDSDELYDILENDIIPAYYAKNEKNISEEWIAKIKNSIQTLTTYYNTHRMIKQYVEMLYLPAYELGKNYAATNFQIARDVALWMDNIEHHWSGVSIEASHNSHSNAESIVLQFGEAWKVETFVKLGQLKPEYVKVQIYLSKGHQDLISDTEFEIFDMKMAEKMENNSYRYQAEIIPSDSGNYAYTFRIIPYHKDLVNSVELGMIKWFPNDNRVTN